MTLLSWIVAAFFLALGIGAVIFSRRQKRRLKRSVQPFANTESAELAKYFSQGRERINALEAADLQMCFCDTANTIGWAIIAIVTCTVAVKLYY